MGGMEGETLIKRLALVLGLVVGSGAALWGDGFPVGPSSGVSLTDGSASTTYFSTALGDQAPYGTFQYNGGGIFEVDLSGLGDEACTTSCSVTFSYTGPTASSQLYEVIGDGANTIDASFSITTPGSFNISLDTFSSSATVQLLDPSFDTTDFLSATFNGGLTITDVNTSATQSQTVSATLNAAPSAVVPEPGTVSLFAAGLVLVAGRFRKKS